MATVDASIPLGVQPFKAPDQLNMLAQVVGLQHAQNQNKLAQYTLSKAQRDDEDQNAIRNALAAPDADPYKILIQRGRFKEATDFQKGNADVAKLKAETEAKQIEAAHKRVDLMGQGLGWLRQNPTLENAQAVVNHFVQNGVMPPEKAQEALAKFQADPTPQGISAFATMGYQAALSAKDQLPQYQTRNTGGSTDTIAIDPVTGKVQVANSVRNTQSPDSVASVAEQRRAHNMADARAREGNEIQRQAARTVVVETPDGPVLADKGTGEGRPVMVGGKPAAGKPSAATEKALTDINQQKSIVAGALQAVRDTPDAFGFTRGLATMAGPLSESVAGRFDNDKQRQARSYLFNNVSKVINERAGAAQSAQELARLRSFLPAETDGAPQIVSKLEAFQTYLGDMEAGTRGKKPAAAPGGNSGAPARISGDAEYNALPSGSVFIGPDGKQRRKP